MATELAKAYIQLVPSAQGIQGSISKIMDGEASSAGKSAGGRFASMFGGAIKTVAAGLGTTILAKDIIDTGLSFDSTMSEVAAISGATGDAFDALREKAQEMGATTKFSASESAEALTYMAMAGWKTDDMLGGIEGIMSLAAASGENLATTSDIVTDALTAFGLAAEDSGHFADVLAAASANANTNVSMLGESFKFVAPVAGALQYSAEDTSIALGLMANAGIKASQAGTALRTLMTNMTKPTSDMVEAMDILDVSLTDEEGTVLSLMDVMEQLRRGFQGGFLSADEYAQEQARVREEYEAGRMTQEGYYAELQKLQSQYYGLEDAQKAELAAMLAGKEGMSGLLAIVNASEEDFGKLTEAIYGADGAAEQMSQIMQDNLQGDLTIAKSALEGMKIALSDKLTPALREVVQFGTNGFSALANAIQSGDWGGLLKNIADTILTGLPELANTAATMMQSFGDYLRENLPGIIETGLQTVKELTASIRENAGIIIDGAIGLALSLAQGLIDSIPAIIENVPEIVSNIANVINDNAPKVLAAGWTLIKALVRGLLESIPVIIENLPKIIAAIWDTITAVNWLNLGGKIIDFLSQGIRGMLSVVLEAAKSIVKTITEGGGLLNLPQMARTWGRDLLSNFIQGIKDKIGALKTSVSNIAKTVRSFIGFSEPETGPLSDFHTFAPDMMQLFAEGIHDNLGLIREAVGDAAATTREELTARNAPTPSVSVADRQQSAQTGGVDAAMIAAAVREALSGMGVYMDGRRVGSLVTASQSNTARAYG